MSQGCSAGPWGPVDRWAASSGIGGSTQAVLAGGLASALAALIVGSVYARSRLSP